MRVIGTLMLLVIAVLSAAAASIAHNSGESTIAQVMFYAMLVMSILSVCVIVPLWRSDSE